MESSDYMFTPAYTAAARAMEFRQQERPDVEIHCAGRHPRGSQGGPIVGGVWCTPVGDVLAVRWRNPDDDLQEWVEIEKTSTWVYKPDFRLPDDFLIDLQPVLLDRPGKRFPAWCHHHGSFMLDEIGIKEKVRRAKTSGKFQSFGAMPPGSSAARRRSVQNR